MKSDQAENRDSSLSVFHVSKGWRIFMFVSLPLVALLFGWVAFLPLTGDAEKFSWRVAIFLTPLGVGVVACCLLGICSVLKSRIEMTERGLRDVDIFKDKTLVFKDLRGFRIVATQYTKVLFLYPVESKRRPHKIALVLERPKEFLREIDRHLPNLDEEERRREEREFQLDFRLGQTSDERTRRLAQARRVARLLNTVSVGAFFWALLYPRPYAVVIWVLVVLPFVAVAVVHFSENLIRLDGNKNSIYPTVGITILMPGIVLCLRALSDINVLSWNAFWPLASVVAVAFFALAYGADKTMRKSVTLVGILVFSAVFGGGSVLDLNRVLDHAPLVEHRVCLLAKRVTSGKGASRYFRVADWSAQGRLIEVKVGKKTYEHYVVGDTVCATERQGGLGIPWVYVR